MGLVQPVLEAGGDQVPVAAWPARAPSVDALGHVEHRVGDRHRRPAARRAPASVRRPRRARRAPPRAPSAGRSGGRARPSQITNPPSSAARDVVGMALELGRRAPARRRRARTGGRRPSDPATIAAALDPSPPDSGMSDAIRNSKSSARVQPLERPHDQVGRGRAATSRSVTAPRTSRSPTTSSSRCSASAAASTSNPGPRLAEEAGTRTTAPAAERHPEDRPLDRAELGLARDDRSGLARARSADP